MNFPFVGVNARMYECTHDDENYSIGFLSMESITVKFEHADTHALRTKKRNTHEHTVIISRL